MPSSDDPFTMLQSISSLTGIALPEPLAALQQKPVRFAGTIEKEDMKQAVLSFIDDISKKQ